VLEFCIDLFAFACKGNFLFLCPITWHQEIVVSRYLAGARQLHKFNRFYSVSEGIATQHVNRQIRDKVDEALSVGEPTLLQRGSRLQETGSDNDHIDPNESAVPL